MLIGLVKTSITVVAGLLVSAGVTVSAIAKELAAPDIAWSDLPDASVQRFEDPYRDLDYDQLLMLRGISQAQGRLADPDLAPDARRSAERDLAALLAKWQPSGSDPDWLISQRWVVAERRQRAGTAGNKDLHGTNASLSGFVIPAPRDAEGRFTAYLVPERGMCSHMPPPPPNQLLRLVFEEAWYPQFIYEPIEVSGRLEIEPTQRTIRVVDGPVNMASTFRLDVARVAPVMPSDTTKARLKPWPLRPHWTMPPAAADPK